MEEKSRYKVNKDLGRITNKASCFIYGIYSTIVVLSYDTISDTPHI